MLCAVFLGLVAAQVDLNEESAIAAALDMGAVGEPGVCRMEDGSYVAMWTQGRQVHSLIMAPIGFVKRMDPIDAQASVTDPTVVCPKTGGFVGLWRRRLSRSQRRLIRYSPTYGTINGQRLFSFSHGPTYDHAVQACLVGDDKIAVTTHGMYDNALRGVIVDALTGEVTGDTFMTSTIQYQVAPGHSLAAVGSGFVVAWAGAKVGEDNRPKESGIFWQMFDARGIRSSAPTKVEDSAVSLIASAPKVTVEAGEFTITWKENSQDQSYQVGIQVRTIVTDEDDAPKAMSCITRAIAVALFAGLATFITLSIWNMCFPENDEEPAGYSAVPVTDGEEAPVALFADCKVVSTAPTAKATLL